MLQGQLDGVLPVKQQLQLLAMPPARKRWVLAKAGREVQKMTRANIRAQKDIYGKPFAKRSDKAGAHKQRLKLLRKMGKKLTQAATSRAVTVGFKGIAGNIAAKHHFGDKKRVTAAGFKREMKQRERGKGYYDNPATKEQAGALVKQLGYKRPSASGKPIRVSQRWIRNHMTIAQAGSIISAMREAQGLPERSNQSWVVETPARPFFGATETDASLMSRRVFAEEIARLQAQMGGFN